MDLKIKQFIKPHSMGLVREKKSGLFRPMPLAYEPMRRNRYLLTIPTDLGNKQFWVRTNNRPSVRHEYNDFNFSFGGGGGNTWQTGRITWDPMEIQIIDGIGDASYQDLFDWVRSFSDGLIGRQGYGGSYKKTLQLELLDPTGISVETWHLMGTIISQMSFEDFEEVHPEITIIFDRAILL